MAMATLKKSKATKTKTKTRGKFTNMEEVLTAVGHVPAYRIRMNPPPGEAKEEDVLAIWEHEDRTCELIDGILVEKDYFPEREMAALESFLAAILIGHLFIFQRDTKQKLGAMLTEGGLLRLFPGVVRAPDVSFILWKNIPNRKFPKDPIASLTPDLAVEILSKGNTEEEMKRKLGEYFQAGSQLVWIVDPKARTVRVYTSPRKSLLRTENQSLDGGKVLPGFSLSIRDWFKEAEEG